MNIVKTTADIKGANSAIVHDLNFDSIGSYVAGAGSKYLLPAMGQATYNVLAGTDGAAIVSAARQLAIRAEANFAVALYVGFGSVKLGENGAVIFADNNTKIASDKKVATLYNSSLNEGLLWREQLVAYINSNPETFTDYANSRERSRNLSRFINTTADFNEALFINNNAVLFNSLLSYISDAEATHIVPLLGDVYTADLRGKLASDTLSNTERTLIEQIARVVANYAIGEAIPYRVISIGADGVFSNTTVNATGNGNIETYQPLDTNRLAMAMGKAQQAGEKHLARLRSFISRNQTDLVGCNTVDTNVRSTLNDASNSFFFA